MPLILKPQDGPTLQPFTFSPSPPATATSLLTANSVDDAASTAVPVSEATPAAWSYEERVAARTLLRPPADLLQERDMPSLGAYPLGERSDQGRGLVGCESCSRVVMVHAFEEHQR